MVNAQTVVHKGDILIVDDDLPSLNVLSTILTGEGYEVRGVPDGQMALTEVENKPPELILLDVKMPGMNGFEVCRQIKSDEKSSALPILFLSALDESADKIKGFKTGAVDFITKPFLAEEVLARVDTQIKLSRLSRNLELLVEKRTAELIEIKDARTEQLAFERLITELAARLAQVQPENIYAEIQEILSSLGQFLQTERAFIFQFTDDKKSLKNTHVWAAEGFNPQSEIFKLDLASDIPWVARQILNGRVIAVGPGYIGLPDEALELRQQLERDGINSGFVVPISVEGRSIGMFGLDTVDKAREYLTPLIERMRVLADMIGSALVRVRAQKKLQKSQHIIESTNNPVGLVNHNLVYQYVNEPYCEALNKSANEIIGHSVPELFGPDFFETVMESYYKRCFAGENVNYQEWFDFPGWGRRYMDVRYYPFREADGRVAAVVTNVHDITELKQNEQKLEDAYNEIKHNEQILAEHLEFEQLIADIAIQLAQTKPEQLDIAIDLTLQSLGRFFRTQRAFLAQFTNGGKRLHHRRIWAAKGIEVPPFFFELDMAAESPWFAQQIRMGKVINTGPGLVSLPDESGDLRQRLKREGINSGVVVPVRVEDRSIGALGLDTVDQPREFPPSIVDRLKIVADTVGSMLHRIQVQTKLQESERRFRAFMDNLPALAYIKDSSDRHLYANKTTLAYLGKQIDEFIGLKSKDIWSDELSEKLKGLDRKVLSGNEAKVIEEWTHDQSGEIHWIRDIKFPIQVSVDEKLLGGIGIDITERKRSEEELEEALSEIKRLNKQLEAENVYLRDEIDIHHKHEEIIGKSEAVRKMLSRAEQVAATDSTVLILGETGTGKELLARVIHRMSSHHHRPMITVNCAALPATLIESEMFGREKGAFTGALSGRIGRFEVADGSTIFLDEIGELTPDVQMKLLRVLEKGHFERLGSNKTIKVDVRIIAATNKDLVKAVHEGSFRSDLFYRLNVFPINVPSLQDRIEDLDLLVWAFVKEFGERMGKRIESIPRKNIEALKKCPWRGNIRELRNVIEQSMIITEGPTLNVQLPGTQQLREDQAVLMKDVERNHILRILQQTGWRVRGKAGAAELLGLKPTTLDARMKKLGIKRPK